MYGLLEMISWEILYLKKHFMQVLIVDRTATPVSTFSLMEQYYDGSADHGYGKYYVRYHSRRERGLGSW